MELNCEIKVKYMKYKKYISEHHKFKKRQTFLKAINYFRYDIV